MPACSSTPASWPRPSRDGPAREPGRGHAAAGQRSSRPNMCPLLSSVQSIVIQPVASVVRRCGVPGALPPPRPGTVAPIVSGPSPAMAPAQPLASEPTRHRKFVRPPPPRPGVGCPMSWCGEVRGHCRHAAAVCLGERCLTTAGISCLATTSVNDKQFMRTELPPSRTSGLPSFIPAPSPAPSRCTRRLDRILQCADRQPSPSAPSLDGGVPNARPYLEVSTSLWLRLGAR